MSERGDRVADKLTTFVGSWRFVIAQAAFLGFWFILNSIAWAYRWDSYPYVLANLVMSAEAAFTGPVILMSSNRSDAADRSVIQQDLKEDTETNRLVEMIAAHLGISND